MVLGDPCGRVILPSKGLWPTGWKPLLLRYRTDRINIYSFNSSYIYIWFIRVAYTHIYNNLLEWLTGCGQVSPTTADYPYKVQASSSSPVYKVGCLSWSSVYSGILKKQALMPPKGWTCQREQEQAGKKQKLPSVMSFLQAACRRCDQV